MGCHRATAVDKSLLHSKSPVRPSAPVVPRWNKGVVEGRTYKNVSVGLELTPAAGLDFGVPAERQPRYSSLACYDYCGWRMEVVLRARSHGFLYRCLGVSPGNPTLNRRLLAEGRER